ncbi:methyltransferase [Pseudoalteromonas denitrificans]|uniref:Methyltransferase domain-containing protein n=1 Tax=Pseudoalteromonas denitrificans DSM 6059 TaxID=1123010 RepID=A0A1I1QKL4_9GAMM|nr:methyltransferase [Pseudoalteromonas denitrificans]SFD22664.1 Methyltransferase domain-containing protein [Pseudoalteromonas denitrificans DSM 6059]
MNYLTHFQQLDQILVNTRHYWQLLAFTQNDLPWPQLNDKLNDLTSDTLLMLEKNPDLAYDYFTDVIPELPQLKKLTSTFSMVTKEVDFPFWLEAGIKGRKLAQLKSFVAAVDETELPVLEWCAGKGHLGRMLAFKGAKKVHSIEIQPHLCEQGVELAKKYEMNINFTQADVLKDDLAEHIKQTQHAVALHACGQLHQTLMRQAVSSHTQKLSLSPCCYHLMQNSETYQAMSDIALTSKLNLSNYDLKLALQETVTAADRITQKRNIEVEWRLGFDQLMRDVTGKDTYVSVPSVSKSMFSTNFEAFCIWAAEKKSLNLPENINFESYYQKGKTRKKITEKIELVRHLFRKPIEIWLILDRVLYLQQHGYHVTVNEFCDKQVTPRNLLIRAQKEY